VLSFAVIITILSLLPSGLLHIVLGKYVYSRDILLIITTCFLMVRYRQRLRTRYRLPIICLGLLMCLTIPLLFTNSVQGMVIWKQFLFWFFGILVGIWIATEASKITLLVGVLLLGAYMMSEVVVGLYEIKSNSFFLEEAPDDTTLFGVNFWRIESLEEHARVKGFQRDPFTYGDLMAVSALFCVWSVWAGRGPLRFLAALSTFPFSYCAFYSTSRSALIGLGFGVVFLTLGTRLKSRAIFKVVPTAAILLLLWLTVNGISPVITYVADSFLRESHLGNLDSTVVRDDEWAEITREWIGREPSILLIGAPYVSVINADVVSFQICDNQYLWFIYHTGLAGLFVVCVLLNLPLFLINANTKINPSYVLYFVLCGFLIGDSVAKEAIFYVTSVFIFMAYSASMSARQLLIEDEASISPRPGPVKLRIVQER
jgi:hypothetical protein